MKLSGKNITVPLARRILGMRGHAVSAFNRCVGGKLRGQRGGSKQERNVRFAESARSCKGTRGK